MSNPLRSSVRNRLARGIAEAFFAGPWTGATMKARALQAVPYLILRSHFGQVVGVVLRAYPRRPPEVTYALVALIERTTTIQLICGKLTTRRPVVFRRFFAPPLMGRMPWPVPALPTVGDLAEWLRLDLPTLDWLADRRGLERYATTTRLRNYRYTWVPKRSGGTRLLEAPKDRLRAAQRRVLHEILDHIPPHEAAHGFRSGRSTLTCATPHVGQAVVVSADMEDFFASVSMRSVLGIFRAAGYPWEVTKTLVALCTNLVPPGVLAARPRTGDPYANARASRRIAGRHLPSGAPTSPALANLCARHLDVRLGAAAAAVGARYTRYADDLTFSGGEDLRRGSTSFLGLVQVIVRDEGFRLHPTKSRVMGRGARQEVVGVVVNEHPAMPRTEYDALRALLHNCVKHGPASQDRVEGRDFRAHLEGRVSAACGIDPHRGGRLRAQLIRIDWT